VAQERKTSAVKNKKQYFKVFMILFYQRI